MSLKMTAFRLDEEVVKALDAKARELGIDRSKFVRHLLSEALQTAPIVPSDPPSEPETIVQCPHPPTLRSTFPFVSVCRQCKEVVS